MRFGLVSPRAERVEFWYQRCDGIRPQKSDKAQDEGSSSLRDRRLKLNEGAGNNL